VIALFLLAIRVDEHELFVGQRVGRITDRRLDVLAYQTRIGLEQIDPLKWRDRPTFALARYGGHKHLRANSPVHF
jgi:hypothetical protein